MFEGGKYTVRNFSSEFEILTPDTDAAGCGSVSETVKKAEKAVGNGVYDAAVTQAYTLPESIFRHMPESKKEKDPGGGVRKKLEAVRRAYDLPADEGSEVLSDKLIWEAEGIMSAVSEMRCGSGFSCGIGDAGVVIKESRAKLF